MDEQQTPNADERFDAWGLVEIMGHNRLAGRITNQSVGGCNFVRVDVPEVDGTPGYTKLLGQSSIFGITITTEAVAFRLAKNMRQPAINPYELREPTPRLEHRDPEEHDYGDADGEFR